MRPLNRTSIRYIVTGSVAAIFYGEPRLTHDVDLVVFLRDSDIKALAEAFPSPDFYLPPPEAIAAEVQREQRGRDLFAFRGDQRRCGCGISVPRL